MKTIQSKLNVLNARKRQILSSPSFSPEETKKLIDPIDKDIIKTVNDIEVINPEFII